MKHVLVLLVNLGLIGFFSGNVGMNAFAEDNPCRTDIAKHCKDIKPGEGRLYNCLKLFDEKLTPSCKQRLVRIDNAIKEVTAICADDYNLYCSSVLPGQGRVTECLYKARKQISLKCRAALAETKRKAEEMKKEMKGQ